MVPEITDRSACGRQSDGHDYVFVKAATSALFNCGYELAERSHG